MTETEKPPVHMTGEHVREALSKNPEWAANLKHPVIVTTFCNLAGSQVTHLSPLLTFEGKNESGFCLDLYRCPHLLSIAGTFHGGVDISESTIERLEDCHFIEASETSLSLDAYDCKNLKKLTGTFPGPVNAEHSGVEDIEGLIITQPNTSGKAAIFTGCKNLTKATGTFAGSVCFQESGVTTIGNLVAKPNVYKDYHINLAATPFATKNPLKAAELTTGSNDLEKWKNISKISNLLIHQLLARAIAMKTMKQPTFEI